MLALAVLAAGVGLGAARVAGSPSSGPDAAASAPPGGPWRLVLDDEMNDPTLFGWLWGTCYTWGCRIPTNPEYEWYQAANVREVGGTARLTARLQASHGQPFTSGMLQSNGRFAFEYGEVEIRAEIPATPGTWPALWLAAANGSWPPEIDVMENWGDQPTQVQQTVILGPPPTPHEHVVVDPALDSGFHTYAVDWEPGEIRWYVDGVLRYSMAASVDTPMYPIMNLAVADPPGPTTAAAYPATFAIDWIRIYQHPGVGTAHCALATCVEGSAPRATRRSRAGP